MNAAKKSFEERIILLTNNDRFYDVDFLSDFFSQNSNNTIINMTLNKKQSFKTTHKISYYLIKFMFLNIYENFAEINGEDESNNAEVWNNPASSNNLKQLLPSMPTTQMNDLYKFLKDDLKIEIEFKNKPYTKTKKSRVNFAKNCEKIGLLAKTNFSIEGYSKKQEKGGYFPPTFIKVIKPEYFVREYKKNALKKFVENVGKVFGMSEGEVREKIFMI